MSEKIVEVRIEGLGMDDRTQSPVVILREKLGERVLPIWIGENEARAIAMELAEKKFTRPLTHDLLVSVIEGLHARVERVVIAELRENTFYAVVLLARGSEFASIDARPSDSIALALKCKSPVFVAEELLLEEGESHPATPPAPRVQTEEERREELRRYLENMKPEDFGKFEL